MKNPIKYVLLCGGLLALGQYASQAADQSTPAAPPMSREDAVLVTVTASVEAVNYTNREVTLKGPRGNTITFVVDERVKRLNEVKAGDMIRADYYLSIAGELRQPTAEEKKNPLTTVEGAAKAPPGTSPAAGALRKFKAVTTVEEIDLPGQTITIKGPRGNSVTIRAADPARLAKVKVGEYIVVTYTEALAISLEKAEKKGTE
jgi:hypothetical protein